MLKNLYILLAGAILVFFVGCNSNDSIPDTKTPTITLIGSSTLNLTVGDAYTDAGATATDVQDGNLTASIVVVNDVNTSTAGTYAVTYNVVDSDGNNATQASRTVIVSVVITDTTAPVITLVGDTTLNLTVGATYTDAGATATDNIDGNLTASIVVVNDVNTSAAATYTVTYNVNDTAGNSATQVSRTVIVSAVVYGLNTRVSNDTSGCYFSYNQNDDEYTVLPTLISNTGCFSGSPAVPSAALIPYDINVPLWTDNLGKSRWMALQNGTSITVEASGQWLFPTGTVLVKDFAKNGKTIETRFMSKHGVGNTNSDWSIFTYVWNDTGTDATILDPGSSLTKTIEGQTWTYPNSAQCNTCHSASMNSVLGPETAQLNKIMTYPSTSISANQIDTLAHIGMLGSSFDTPSSSLSKLPATDDTTASLESRARAYLHGNCLGCHTGPHHYNTTDMDMRYDVALADTKLCDDPMVDSFGLTDAKIIKPGDANNSVLVYRMKTNSGTSTSGMAVRMPPFGSHIVDDDGIALLTDWINSLSVADCN